MSQTVGPERAQRPGVGDRLARLQPRRTATLGLLLAIAAFAVYGLTAGTFSGYEDETAAVSAGLVEDGQLVVEPGNPISGQGIPGRDGRRYSRTGLTQPLIEAPFFAVGLAMDKISSDAQTWRWRRQMLELFDPFMAAVTVLAIFALLTLRGVETRRALVVAALAAFGSIIWPYSKMGMETTGMALLALSFVAAAWASRGSYGRWALTGVVAGGAAASMGFMPVLMLGILPLLFERFDRLSRREQLGRLAAAAAPLLIWIVAIGWYNAYRTGSVTNFDDVYSLNVLSAPFSAAGLFASPGKGLLLYSPLVILGLIGFRSMWRRDRILAIAVLAAVLPNTLVIAIKSGWADETWGPRYLVPSAWLLLLPLAWWTRGPRRWRITLVTALVAFVIQVGAVFTPYGVSVWLAEQYAGQPVYDVTRAQAAPYGDDGPRWIPEVSPLLFSSEVLASWVAWKTTGSGFTFSYHPRGGRFATINLSYPEKTLNVGLPDFWWKYQGTTDAMDALALILFLTGVGASGLLVWGFFGVEGGPLARWRISGRHRVAA